MKVLVTGATGYIGGRLVPRLINQAHQVRCMTRDPAQLTLDPWRAKVEVVAADALQSDTLTKALEGCDAAYYLIHSMTGSRSFAELDRRSAEGFRDAADAAGLKRIIYLGGLGSDEEALSDHLNSRHEVGRILASGSSPVTEYRAAAIIGSGSLSFEMIRHSTEVLPIIMTPKWVRTRCQPIAVRNVLEILISALDDPDPTSKIYDIGGPDILNYQEMMQVYAEVAGLRRRLVIPLPIGSVRLSPLAFGLITPLPVSMVRPLIQSLGNDVVVARPTPPGFDPSDLFTYRHSLELAMTRISDFEVETRWTDALSTPAAPMPSDPVWSGAKMFVDHRIVFSHAPMDDVFWAVTRIGGDVGYYTMNWAWALRGWFDKLIGGTGLRRGRRHPIELRKGESLDFFRVAEVDPKTHKLTLRAEMKVPGTAWLGWSIEPTATGSRLIQGARFVPRGLMGRLYWWVLLPFHAPIFRRMAKRIAHVAENRKRVEVRRERAKGQRSLRQDQ